MTTDLTAEFFKLKYIDKRPKRDILQTLKLSGSGFDELVLACQDQKKEHDRWYQLYKRKVFEHLSFAEFLVWVNQQDPQCYYCRIHQSEIDLLFKKQKVYTKRAVTRGRRLELERVLPNESYNNITNLQFCCYWCNNAKSDEFDKDEFKTIAQAIGKVWKQRLLNETPPDCGKH